MPKSVVSLLFILIASAPVFAADTAPSPASLQKLLEVTETRKLIEGSMAQMDAMIQRSTQQSMQGQVVGPEKQKILDELRGRVVKIMQEEITWDRLEPAFVDIYTKSFTQKEVDGMLAFYETDVGKSMITKMPQVMQLSMELVQTYLGDAMPKVQRAQEEAVAQLKALDEK
jgi:uncharacterized protein